MVSFRGTILILLAMALLLAVVPADAQTGYVGATATGSLTATNAGCTATACVSIPLTYDTASVAWQIAGTFTGTITFEGTVDGTNYVALAVVPVGSTRTLTTTATAAGTWQHNVAGLRTVRARCSAYTSGTIAVTARRSAGTAPAQ